MRGEGDQPRDLAAAQEIGRALKDTADVAVELMTPAQHRDALLAVCAAAARLESLRLRLIATAGTAVDEDGSRDVAAWLTAHTRSDRGRNARSQRLARSLDRAWPRVRQALAQAEVNLDQAEVIVRSLEQLPPEVGQQVLERAEAHLVEAAAEFGPRELRVLGRRILDVVAPELGEEAERRALAGEERRARRTTSLVTHRNGDGSTTIRIKLPDASADRLLTYLDAFSSPRRERSAPTDEQVRHDVKLGRAFCALLEAIDPTRLPLHGGDATTVLVTVDLQTLKDGLGTAGVGSVDRITAFEARRLACTARIAPMVLGGSSEVLDLGRSARLFTRAQRKAMAAVTGSAGHRDVTSRPPGAKHITTAIPGLAAAAPTSPTASCCARGTTTAPTTTATSTRSCPTATCASTGADRRRLVHRNQRCF